MKRAVVLALIALFLAPPATAGKKEKEDEQVSEVSFLVLKDENGKPVRNAAVILHQVKENGKQGRGGIELKTDQDGKITYSGVPYGQLRVQVIAPGLQTFGQDYNIDQPKYDITIKLKPPAKQYSIYDK
jgi:uncharacterized GH25 family protein